MILFHLTDPANAQSILENGIVPNEDGHVYAIIDLLVSDTVARSQLFVPDYAVFAIHPRYLKMVTVIDDPVHEVSASYHRVIVADNPIPPDCVLHLGNRKVADVSDWDLLVEWVIFGHRCTAENLRDRHQVLRKACE